MILPTEDTLSLLTPTINKDVTEQLKDQQQVNYNKGARPLPPLSEGTLFNTKLASHGDQLSCCNQ